MRIFCRNIPSSDPGEWIERKIYHTVEKRSQLSRGMKILRKEKRAKGSDWN